MNIKFYNNTEIFFTYSWFDSFFTIYRFVGISRIFLVMLHWNSRYIFVVRRNSARTAIVIHLPILRSRTDYFETVHSWNWLK